MIFWLPASLLHLITRLLRIAGVACAALTLGSAWAQQEYITQTAFLVDQQGRLDIHQVAQMPFAPAPMPLARGYTDSVTWLRIDVQASALPELTLVVRPAYHDDLRLYASTPSGGWSEQRSGGLLPYVQRERPEVNFAFTLQPSATHGTRYYLRIQSRHTTLVHVSVMSPPDTQKQDSIWHTALGLYCGLLLLLIWLSMLRWWISRDVLWLYSLFYLCTTLAFAPVITGFVGKYLLPHDAVWPDRFVSVLSCLHFFSVTLLMQRLFKAYQPPRWTLAGYWIELLLGPVLIVMAWDTHVRLALSINASLILFQGLWGGCIIWLVPFRDTVLQWLMRSIYFGLTLMTVYFALPLLGLLPASHISLYPALLANMFISIMQYLAITRRQYLGMRLLQEGQLRAQTENAELNAKQKQLQESASFLGMLLHEIKTPLSTIKLAALLLADSKKLTAPERHLRLANIQKAVGDIGDVLSHIELTDKLEHHAQRVELAIEDLAAELRSLAKGLAQSPRMVLDIPESLRVHTDVALISLMVRNLLNNALTYSPADSPVVLRLVTEAAPVAPSAQPGHTHMLRIQVGNRLLPNDKPDLAQLFSKYYRSDSARQYTGTGLGLYWVKGVAAILQGGITADINGDAITFTLWIPC